MRSECLSRFPVKKRYLWWENLWGFRGGVIWFLFYGIGFLSCVITCSDCYPLSNQINLLMVNNIWGIIIYIYCMLLREIENLFTQEYHIPWGQRPRGIWYSWVNKFSYFLNLHAINVLLYRMKPRKHIHVKYCWQTYFKSIGMLSDI